MRTIVTVSITLLVLALTGFGGGEARAQTCDADYKIKPGDSLFMLAKKVYGDESKWPILFYTNQDVLGNSPSVIRPGEQIRIPCLAVGRPKRVRRKKGNEALSPPTNVELRLLTGDDYPPFTDRGLENGGMITDLIVAALNQLDDAPSFGVFWVNRWAVHLDPLLQTTAFDAGFPWFRPDCDYRSILAPSDAGRCDFLFSDQIQSLPVKLFVRKNSNFEYRDDNSIVGKKLCRPTGYFIFDLDQYGRRWLADGKIVLVRPETPAECFRKLVAGDVDAVAMGALVGQKNVIKLDLGDQIREIEKELSTEGLHMLVHKNNPKAEEYIDLVNKGLRQLKKSGEFRQISARHIMSPKNVAETWGTVK